VTILLKFQLDQVQIPGYLNSSRFSTDRLCVTQIMYAHYPLYLKGLPGNANATMIPSYAVNNIELYEGLF
jgi:hypothetical protein